MDFYTIRETVDKDGVLKIHPNFVIVRSKDLMVRSKSFYAIWDEKAGLWSTDEYDVQRLVDQELLRYAKDREWDYEGEIKVSLMRNFDSNAWKQFRSYMQHLSDSSTQLDSFLAFSNTEVKKSDFISRRLPYPLEEGPIHAWDTLLTTLYSEGERAKIEWALGAILTGDAKEIQKFLVFYGPGGTGKSTVLNIVQKLFVGYYAMFEAKALTGGNNAFSTEVFRSNPLVAIQHDGDLSKIEDNTKLNSIISHEEIPINEKFKSSYMAKINAFLLMGTNKPVKISDAKSGLIRRLIDVRPTGKTIPEKKYHALISQVDFELGAIADHCIKVYRRMGREYFSSYRAVEMMLTTDVFYNFVEDSFSVFEKQNGTTLAQAWEMYKVFCTESKIEFVMPRYKFREELTNYFDGFDDRHLTESGERVRSWYSGFRKEKFAVRAPVEEHAYSLTMTESVSLLDTLCGGQPAQYANEKGTPIKKWIDVDTRLSDLDTHQIHYVKLPENHIVIDFDLKDEHGNKSAERNLEAASKWPATYAEWSKGGGGIHLHYYYSGDTSELSRIFDEAIEVKVFVGDSSLRRRVSKCNNVPIATISGGLPLKEKRMINFDTIGSERSLRNQIMRNLRKEIHPGTKPSIDFIHKILEDAYSSDLVYDVEDMRQNILAFANNSTNNPEYCLKTVLKMKFKSEDPENKSEPVEGDTRLVYFDTECFPNLFAICWKFEGEGKEVVRMLNPSPKEIEPLFKMRLVGYNCRRYDNHMLYAAYMGYSTKQLHELSKRLIANERGAFFGEAYDISYLDIYDVLSIKKSLKQWQIDLGIHHMELGQPWDEPLPEEYVEQMFDYCGNDVISEEAVLEHRSQDLVARQILAEISGLPVNATTQMHTSRIVFGKDRKPQDKFKYVDLNTIFPGYEFKLGKSRYRDEDVNEGGYVYAEPGMYTDVVLLDVASMHPTSIELLDLFGPYTKNFNDLKAARIAIKHGDYASARKMLGGALAKHLGNEENAKALSYALKIIINIVYGLTAARFENSFRDTRNVDNIVAKRGALFMIDLKHAVQEKGFTVAHIKTDSIKIPNATPEIIQFVMEFGEKYGYTFEHEKTYEKFALVNDAVYVSKIGWSVDEDEIGEWSATGAQFAHPYVFKTLFSHEPITFNDKCESKSVTTSLYLDFNSEDTPMVLEKDIRFVGRTGRFCPIMKDRGGARLLREKGGKFYAATGTKGYFWLESEMVQELKKQDDIDMRYFKKLVDDALANLAKYGDVEWFIQ